MKRAIALFTLSALLLTGCSGTVAGTDKVVPVSGYIVDKSSPRIIPTIKTGTLVVQYCDTLLKAALGGDVATLYNGLIFGDNTFVTLEGFTRWFQNSGITEEYTLTEQITSKVKYIICTCANGVTYSLAPIEQEDGSYKYTWDSVTTKNYKLTAPVGIPVKLDGVDISSYGVTNDNIVTYTIPELINEAHNITVSTVFSGDIEMQVSSTVSDFDVSPYLIAEEPLRSQLIQTASKTIETLNKLVVAQDWDKFTTFFTPGLNTSPFSGAFYRGRTKSKVYDLKLVDTRDLELGDDVVYTGYNTVKITLGTRWTWAGVDNFRVNDTTGEVTINKISEMRIRNVLELYYDTETKKWYVNYIDDESLAGLVEGLEDWR